MNAREVVSQTVKIVCRRSDAATDNPENLQRFRGSATWAIVRPRSRARGHGGNSPWAARPHRPASVSLARSDRKARKMLLDGFPGAAGKLHRAGEGQIQQPLCSGYLPVRGGGQPAGGRSVHPAADPAKSASKPVAGGLSRRPGNPAVRPVGQAVDQRSRGMAKLAFAVSAICESVPRTPSCTA